MKLRGHHLICLQFFKGEGYSKDFVENTKRIVEDWGENDAEIVKGADDVCCFCPFMRKFFQRNQRKVFECRESYTFPTIKNGKCNHPKYKEEIEKTDEFALKMLGLKIGDKVKKDFVKKQLPKIFSEWKEKACKNCEWKKLCESEYKS